MPSTLANRRRGKAFDPTAIPGLQFWLRGDRGVGITSSKASSWSDAAGLGNGCSLGDSACWNMPGVYVGADQAGNNMSLLLPALPLSLRSLSIFLVYGAMSLDNSALFTTPTMRCLLSSAGAELLGYDCVPANATAWDFITNDHANRFGSIRLPASTSFVGFTAGVAAQTHYVNDQTAVFGAMANVNSTYKKMFGFFVANYGFGRIYQVMAYNRPLGPIEVQALRHYCYNAYQIPQNPPNQVVYVGDSLTSGQNSTQNQNYPYQVAYPWPNRYYNYGSPGQLASSLVTYASGQAGAMFNGALTRNIAVVWIGTNDLSATVAPATVYANLQSICSTIKGAGFKVLVLTCLPRNGAGQFETDRQTYNTSIRNGFSGATLACDAVVDVGANATIGVAGAQLNATYYNTSDQTHLTNAGYAIVAGLVGTALGTL